MCSVTPSRPWSGDALVSRPAWLQVRVAPVRLRVRAVGGEWGEGAVTLEGGSVGAECRAEGGIPAPTISWQLSPALVFLSNSSSTPDQDTARIVVKSGRSEVPATLTCLARHALLARPLQATLNITVHCRSYMLYVATRILCTADSPEISLKPTSLKLPEGGELELQCEVAASPAPHLLKWTREGVAADWRDGGWVWRSLLRLDNFTRSEAGDWGCEAENSVGRAAATSVVTVLCECSPPCPHRT